MHLMISGFGQSFSASFLGVFSGWLVVSETDHGDHVERRVGLAVSAPVEPVALLFT